MNDIYVGYHAILETYNCFGTALYTFLTDIKTISMKTAHLAARTINHDKTKLGGRSILYYLLKSRNHLLGGDSDDIITEIAYLSVKSSEDIHSFFEQVTTL